MFDGLTGEKLLVLVSRDHDQLAPAFLPHLLGAPLVKRWAAEKAIGSVTPHFRWSDLAACRVPLHTIHVQVSAARLLDQMLRTDDALRDAMASAEVWLQARLHTHFTQHADVCVSVFDRATALSGGTPSRDQPEYWDGDVPWLSPKDMKSPVIHSTSEHISDAAVAAGHSCAPTGATFVVVRGMILQHSFPVCRSAVPMAFNQDIKAFVPGAFLDPNYLSLWFRWAAPQLLRLVSETSHGTKRIETDRLRRAPFSGASLADQHAFVEEVESIECSLKSLVIRRAELDRLRNILLRELELS